jgi:transposase
MSKNNRKDKSTEYAIKYLYEINKKDIKSISLELGISEAIVEGVVNEKPEPKPKKISKSQNLMIRHTSNKKTNNVSVMTEAASQLNDELKKKMTSTASRTAKDSIFRPND